MKSTNFAAIGVAVTLTCASFASSAATTYVVSNYTVPGSTSTQLWGINDQGVLVGRDDAGGFIDAQGQITTVNLPGMPSTVTGISNDGVAVGGDVSATYSFFYNDGVLTPFAVPGAVQTLIRGISANSRWVTGVSTSATGQFDGFVLDTSTSKLSLLTPPGDSGFTVVQGVTDDGLAVGSLNNGESVVFDARQGTTRYVTELAGLSDVRIRAIDDAGDLGGWYSLNGRDIGFTDTSAGGLQTFDLGAGGTLVYGLNNAGQAVGYDIDAEGVSHGFTLTATAVPEPASAVLMALGLVAGLARRTQRRMLDGTR